MITSQFVSDDWDWLSHAASNASIFSNLITNAVGGNAGGSYNPIASVWMNIHYALFGLHPAPYHITSIVLHAINALLVGSLLMEWLSLVHADEPRSKNRLWGAIAGLLFLVIPTGVEAVSWVASVPHLLATTFYVLTLRWYIHWRRTSDRRYAYLSLIAACVALLSKEIAISLPIVIIFLEIFYRYIFSKHFSVKEILQSALWIIPAAIYVFARYRVTGLLFGTYAEEQLVIRPTQVMNNFYTFFIDFMTLGTGRNVWMEWFWASPRFFVITMSLIFFAGVILILWKKRFSAFLFASMCCISIAPYLLLGFNRTSQESERYTYLPAVFFIIAAVLIGTTFAWKRVRSVFIVLLIVSSFVTIHKTASWALAGGLSEAIINSAGEIVSTKGTSTAVFIGLPDTVDGAHVFRNNIAEALKLRYPKISDTVILLPIYLQLRKNNYLETNLSWTSDERGFFARSISGEPLVTGFDRRVLPLLTYELWNYDYAKFNSDTVRLLFSEDTIRRVKQGDIRFFTWNGGSLVELSWEDS